MVIKFKSETFAWLYSNCGDISPAAFVVKLVEEKINDSKKGVEKYGVGSTRDSGATCCRSK